MVLTRRVTNLVAEPPGSRDPPTSHRGRHCGALPRASAGARTAPTRWRCSRCTAAAPAPRRPPPEGRFRIVGSTVLPPALLTRSGLSTNGCSDTAVSVILAPVSPHQPLPVPRVMRLGAETFSRAECSLDALVRQGLVAVERAHVGGDQGLDAVARFAWPPRRAERRPGATSWPRRGGSRRSASAGDRPSLAPAAEPATSSRRSVGPRSGSGTGVVGLDQPCSSTQTREEVDELPAGSEPTGGPSSARPARRRRCRPPSRRSGPSPWPAGEGLGHGA